MRKEKIDNLFSISDIVSRVRKEEKVKVIVKHERIPFTTKDILSAGLIMKRFPKESDNESESESESEFFEKFPSVKRWLETFQKQENWEEKLTTILRIFEKAKI